MQIIPVLTPLRQGLSLLNPEVRDESLTLIRARVGTDGKFSKFEVFYFPITPIPPAAWFYDCADCVFYEPSTRGCEVVEGIIEPYAWCVLWVNNQDDKPFSWIGRAFSL